MKASAGTKRGRAAAPHEDASADSGRASASVSGSVSASVSASRRQPSQGAADASKASRTVPASSKAALAPAGNKTLEVHRIKPSDAPELRPGRDYLSSFLSPLDIHTFKRTAFREKYALAIIGGGVDRVKRLIDEYLFGGDAIKCAANTPSEAIHVWMRQTHAHTHTATAGRAQDSAPIESIKLDPSEADAARVCHGAGASLYFRAPAELESVLVPSVCASLDMGFSAWWDHTRSQPRGEIETFVSRKGHVTAFHADFQENFTVQLAGRKRWRFKASAITSPSRGFTPQFTVTPDVAEQQIKLNRLVDAGFEQAPPPEFFEEGVHEVILDAGDCLYFPAGVWHEVTALDDSLSINISLANLTWAEVAASALRHVLLRDAQWRQMVSLDPAGAVSVVSGASTPPASDDAWTLAQTYEHVDAMLTRMKAAVMALKPEHLLPRAALLEAPELHEQGASDASSDDADSTSSENAPEVPYSTLQALDAVDSTGFDISFIGSQSVITIHDLDTLVTEAASSGFSSAEVATMLVNPVSVMVPWGNAARTKLQAAQSERPSDVESSDASTHDSNEEDDALAEAPDAGETAYVVHVNFGNDEFSSLSRTLLHVPEAMRAALDLIAAQTSGTAPIDEKRCFSLQNVVPVLPAVASKRRRDGTGAAAVGGDREVTRAFIADVIGRALQVAGLWSPENAHGTA